MAGHSKWAQIKRQKAVTDAKRGQLFTKVGRELTIAAQQGGPDPVGNFRLEQAIAKAKAANMPKDTIARAIQRGGGGGADGAQLEELLYEGYAVDGAGLLIEVVTDNRNRSVAEVRNALNRLGGTLASSGSVSWQFETRGAIEIKLDGHDPEDLELAAIDLGAVDVEHSDEVLYVYTDAIDLARGQERADSAGRRHRVRRTHDGPNDPHDPRRRSCRARVGNDRVNRGLGRCASRPHQSGTQRYAGRADWRVSRGA